MQEATGQFIQGEDRNGVLDLGAIRAHNSHLSIGKGHTERCGICKNGLEGALPAYEEKGPDPETPVDEGDGADKEGDTTSPSGSGAYYRA